MTDITIFHNPRCSKSRATLALIENKTDNLTVVEYLKTPPSLETLKQIIELLGFSSARQLMRTNEDIYKTLVLKDLQDEDKLLQVMLENPKLIERPIVLAYGRDAIGRPPESVLDII